MRAIVFFFRHVVSTLFSPRGSEKTQALELFCILCALNLFLRGVATRGRKKRTAGYDDVGSTYAVLYSDSMFYGCRRERAMEEFIRYAGFIWVAGELFFLPDVVDDDDDIWRLYVLLANCRKRLKIFTNSEKTA